MSIQNEMRGVFSRQIGIRFRDYIKQTEIRETLKFLELSQFWESDRIEKYQFEKLLKLIVFASKKVPYYRDLFKKEKLKISDFTSLNDISKIPILTKEIARNHFRELIADGLNMKYVKVGKTGGTTGSPLLIYKDASSRSFSWASYYRWYRWMGVEFGDKVFTFWGANSVTYNSIKNSFRKSAINYLFNHTLIDAFQLNEVKIINSIERINKYKPVLVKGYLSALIQIANYLNNNKISLDANIKALSSTTETLLPHLRDLLQNTFKSPMYDQYGCGEVSAIAYECNCHMGLHVNMEHIILEILDKKGSRIVGTSGRIVATDLDNFAMPFIRYETGDMGTLNLAKCPCGVNQPLLSSIDGRTIDTIVLANGNRVHGVFITDILYELKIFTDQIKRFQVEQDEPGVILLKFECTSSILDTATIQQLNNALKPFFRYVEIVFVDLIENEPNGKFRYIKSRIPSHADFIGDPVGKIVNK